MRALRRPPWGLLPVFLTALLAACGAPTDEAPRALPANDVPFGLLAPDPSATTTTVHPAASSEVTIYLAGRERLVPVERRVPAPASVEKVVRTLLTGPTDAEARRGLRSAINPGTTVLSAPVEAGIATIDLSGDFAVGAGPEQIVALAQVVYTATSLGGVVGVRFTLGGRPAEVPDGDGTLSQAPLGRAAYASFAPL